LLRTKNINFMKKINKNNKEKELTFKKLTVLDLNQLRTINGGKMIDGPKTPQDGGSYMCQPE
jgi:hypothetical protein